MAFYNFGLRLLRHVRDAAADLIEAILAHAASVRILATNREGLEVADEQLWLVPSLDVDAGIDSPAVTLFVERARNVTQRFSLDGGRSGGSRRGHLPTARRHPLGHRTGRLADGVDARQ